MIQWGGAAPASFLRLALTAIAAEYFGAAGATGIVKLFQNDYTPSIASEIGDLVEATFDGYASDELLLAEFSGSKSDAEGNAYRVYTALVRFQQTGVVVTNTVYGWYIVDEGEAELIAAKRFDAPIVFDHVGKDIYQEIAIRVPVGGFEIGDDTTEGA